MIDTKVDEFPRYVVEYAIVSNCCEMMFHVCTEKVVRRPSLHPPSPSWRAVNP
ncbi:MAG: hypothetical protein AB1898_29635 [Acidobacteriota bacterium]